MTSKQKKLLFRIILSTLFTVILQFLPASGVPKLVLYAIPYLVIGYDILLKAARGIINGRVLDECFLMSVATVGAFVLGFLQTEDYLEAVAVMLFFQIGELFESYAVGKSRKSISALMDIRPDCANIRRDGILVPVAPEEVETGTVITVKPGEKIPIDGVVVSGESSLNTSALTGESLPADVYPGSEVFSGCVNLTGVLEVKTSKPFGQSTVSKILDLVENASSRKSKSEDFIAKFARIYTPAVCISALVLAVIPPILGGTFKVWLYRALAFLVASCPCALVVSIPLTFFAGLGGASKAGILIKGSNYLEALSKTKYICFDKTGTLTQGVFEVTDIAGDDPQKVLEYAALCEISSSHPIAVSLRKACDKELDANSVKNVREIGGKGVTATADGVNIAAGNLKLMADMGIDVQRSDTTGTAVYVAADGQYLGHIIISDKIKPDCEKALKALKKSGVKKTVMLTGDNEHTAKAVAQALNIDEYHYGLLPEDKVNKVEELINAEASGEKLAFAGDGINDAPVLARADIGIAMGALGSDAAIEAADVVLMDDDPAKISKALMISKKCLNIVYQNIALALGIKAVALLLVAIGTANMWFAVFADVGVMVLAVLNSVRALKL